MSGNRFLLDTNAVILLLSAGLPDLESDLQGAEWLGFSVITRLEFLSFPRLTVKERSIFDRFCDTVTVCDLRAADHRLIDDVIDFRSRFGLKLPDSIVAATSKSWDATLVTADQEFTKLDKELSIRFY